MQLKLSSPTIYLASTPVDFRRSIDGLCAEVLDRSNLKPQDGIFVFYNQRRDKLKVLAWHHNGFVMIYKRLEKGKFFARSKEEQFFEMDENQLSWLLAGLDWGTMSGFKELEYDDYT